MAFQYKHLPNKHKELISQWMYEETTNYFNKTKHYPKTPEDIEEVAHCIYERVLEREIYLPYYALLKRYSKSVKHIVSVLHRKQSGDIHNREKVVFMNMCMIQDGEYVLALDKEGKHYSGTTFPGGHVEKGEFFTTSVIREVKEETGLEILDPKLCGIYHFYMDEIHNVGLIYKAYHFSGELKDSEEGKVYWIKKEEYEKKELAPGMHEILALIDSDIFFECFKEFRDDGTVVEHLM